MKKCLKIDEEHVHCMHLAAQIYSAKQQCKKMDAALMKYDELIIIIVPVCILLFV